MSGRKKLIIGNWKMNFTVKQAVSFAHKLAQKTLPEGVAVVVAPTLLSLSEVSAALSESDIHVAAQNAYFQDDGAFTGEVSMPMLRTLARYVVIGHSERRHIFHESNDLIRHKVAAANRSGLKPILCIGETMVERQHFHTKQVLIDQLVSGLADLTAEEVAKVVVAYEPVWAISEGRSATSRNAAMPEDAQKAAEIVRKNITELYGADVARKVKVLYGGSVHADNASAFLQTEGIDGLLVGGASLGVATFWPIVEKACEALPKQIKVGQSNVKE